MPKLRNESSKSRLLRNIRKQRLKYITILPSLITLINGFCGFAAIGFASRVTADSVGEFSLNGMNVPYFAIAGYLILLAMIADMLDGRVARMSQSTSSFGGQLDSLCDMISFGVAPAFLMLKIVEFKMGSYEGINLFAAGVLKRWFWLAALAYIACTAIRLARFNVENEEDESAHMSFMGLPTPAAAGVIVSLVIFHQYMLKNLASESSVFYPAFDNLIMFALPAVTLGLGLLMVSRIRYPHVVNQYLKGKKPPAYLIKILIFLGIILWNWQIALVLIFCGFALSGFLKWVFTRITTNKKFGEILKPAMNEEDNSSELTCE